MLRLTDDDDDEARGREEGGVTSLPAEKEAGEPLSSNIEVLKEG